MKVRTELWDAINQYVVACGGDPSKYAYGNEPRQRAVSAVERAVDAECTQGEIQLLDAVAMACGRLVPDACVDTRGQLYGISSAKEVVVGMLKTRLNQ